MFKVGDLVIFLYDGRRYWRVVQVKHDHRFDDNYNSYSVKCLSSDFINLYHAEPHDLTLVTDLFRIEDEI